MNPSTDCRAALRRRLWLGSALALAGLGLSVFGLVMLYTEGASTPGAATWALFFIISFNIFLQGLLGACNAGKLLKALTADPERVPEQLGERERLVDQTARAAVARAAEPALLAAMLGALLLKEMAVCLTLFGVGALMALGTGLAKWWYRRKL